MMYNSLFSKENDFMKATAGLVLAVLAIVSVYSNIPIRLAHAAPISGLVTTGYAADASKTALVAGDQLIIHFDYTASFADLLIDPAGTCTVNTKDVRNSFQSFNDGHSQIVYGVAAGDPQAAAGAIPFHCDLKDTDGNTTTVSSFSGGSTISINTTGGGDDDDDTGGTPGQISNSSVVAVPNTGTLGIGSTLEVHIRQADQMNDLTMADGFCMINNIEVRNFENLGGGHYKITYTYTNQSANVASGQLTFSCNVKNGSGQTAILHFTEANTLVVATQTDDDDGLPLAGTFQISAQPSSGTLTPGNTVIVHVNDSGGITDFAIDPLGTCTINGKDVKSSFQSFGDHTYQMTYTVAQGDANVAAGQLAVSCVVKNSSGVTGTINAFTDSNTVAINTSDTGGNTDTDSTTDGTIDGNVNGGIDTAQVGVLAVTSVDQVRPLAVADGIIENGWKWVFHVTVPTNETSLQVKFGNWTHTNGVNSIASGGTMRFSSPQAGNTSPITISAADTYSGAISITGDLNTSMPGKQVEVVVEMGVPIGSANGAYTTSYNIKTSQN